MSRLFCFGYGYTCDYLGHMLKEQGGWDIAGTTRDPDKKRELRDRGIKIHIFDYSQPLSDPAVILDGVTHILVSTPPGGDGDPAFLVHAADILKVPTVKWLGYLSTTGVYGNLDGGWVDENSPVRPISRRGDRRAKAEEQWMSMFRQYKLPVHIFRLAGIYGPGRSALDSVRAGVATRIDKPGHVSNRVHVEDIAQVLAASMNNPDPGSVYNVSDDLPAPSHEIIECASTMLGLESPPLVPVNEANLAPIARSYYSANKRVRNDKIKRELGVRLKYPDYTSGLKACMEAEEYALQTMQRADDRG